MNRLPVQFFIGLIGFILGIYIINSRSNLTANLSNIRSDVKKSESIRVFPVKAPKKSKFTLKMSPTPLVTFDLTPMPLVTEVTMPSVGFVSPQMSPQMTPLTSYPPDLSTTQIVIYTAIPSSANQIQSPMASPTPSSEVTPLVTPLVTPRPSAEIAVSLSSSPAPSPAASASELPATSGAGSGVVINEIGWMGTLYAATDEWLELYNGSNIAINLDNWTLKSDDGSPNLVLKGIIDPGGYYLIERTDDKTISDIKADLASSFGKGGLNNDGEKLILADKSGNLIDLVDCSAGWYAGDNVLKLSMERINLAVSGTVRTNWASNKAPGPEGKDGAGNVIHGTPKHKNSVSI